MWEEKNNNSGGGGDLMKQLREKQIKVHDLEATVQLGVTQGRQREIWRRRWWRHPAEETRDFCCCCCCCATPKHRPDSQVQRDLTCSLTCPRPQGCASPC